MAHDGVSHRILVVSIDIGTTSTAASYWIGFDSGNSEARDIRTIDDWPALKYNDRNQMKVPTLIDYGSESTTWGYMIPEGATRVPFIKLLMLDKNDLPLWLQDNDSINSAIVQLMRLGRSPMTVMADFRAVIGGVPADEAFRNLVKGQVGARVWENIDPRDRESNFHTGWDHNLKRNFDGTQERYDYCIGD
ncbi:hypothetical protein BKA67DRAFT_669672 [Truncatella angustata]|uniref:Uncharacterized protein n=1 Tax=Truncatella angustata TaxID=152316 RepID=A0A9P8UBK8_9PEZI|nr:uncharacterized protein BKA67DRAFT_669672 [Truncatella angustata]KAH6645501.1 hypothetical protein BKA67DRAFT_669672 [Truncatella angustata]KAH8196474.1 hypothetical protein TruAng_009372 [Truncatella angustata]